MESNRRVIGLFGCIALTLGHVVGSGIFTSSTEIIRGTSSIGLSLFVWLFTGLLSMTGGLTFAEIASTIPISGAGASYMKFIGLRSIAFCFAFSQVFLIFPTIICLQALTFAQYFRETLDFAVEDSTANFYTNSGIGICILVILLILNCFVKFTHILKYNIVMAGFKIATLLAIVIMACFSGKIENLSQPFTNSTLDPDRIASSSYSAMFAFEGYDLICIGVEEVIAPERNLPLAITLALIIVTIMYLSVNTAYCLVLGTQNLIELDAIDSLNRFSQLSLGRASFIIPLLITICMIQSMNCTIFGASRIIHVSAREELLPGWLSCWNEKVGSPRAALVFHITLAIIILLLLNLTTISNINELEYLTKWTQGSFVTFLLLFIRLTRVEVKNKIIRVNILLPSLYLICLTGLILSTLFTKWTQLLLMFGIFGISLSIYFILVRPTGLRRLNGCERLFDSIGASMTNIAQRIFSSSADRQPVKSQPLMIKKRKY